MFISGCKGCCDYYYFENQYGLPENENITNYYPGVPDIDIASGNLNKILNQSDSKLTKVGNGEEGMGVYK